MKTVLISGAYRGLGYEVARQLSQRGWQVILTARNKNQGAAGIVWLAADAPEEKTGLFWRDKEVIPW